MLTNPLLPDASGGHLSIEMLREVCTPSPQVDRALMAQIEVLQCSGEFQASYHKYSVVDTHALLNTINLVVTPFSYLSSGHYIKKWETLCMYSCIYV